MVTFYMNISGTLSYLPVGELRYYADRVIDSDFLGIFEVY